MCVLFAVARNTKWLCIINCMCTAARQGNDMIKRQLHPRCSTANALMTTTVKKIVPFLSRYSSPGLLYPGTSIALPFLFQAGVKNMILPLVFLFFGLEANVFLSTSLAFPLDIFRIAPAVIKVAFLSMLLFVFGYLFGMGFGVLSCSGVYQFPVIVLVFAVFLAGLFWISGNPLSLVLARSFGVISVPFAGCGIGTSFAHGGNPILTKFGLVKLADWFFSVTLSACFSIHAFIIPRLATIMELKGTND